MLIVNADSRNADLKLMLNWDSEIVICSRFVNCELWPCDMNSTLGSVVPLAMFLFHRNLRLVVFLNAVTVLCVTKFWCRWGVAVAGTSAFETLTLPKGGGSSDPCQVFQWSLLNDIMRLNCPSRVISNKAMSLSRKTLKWNLWSSTTPKDTFFLIEYLFVE